MDRFITTLKKEAKRLAAIPLEQLVQQNNKVRCVETKNVFYDYTKNFIDDSTLQLLFDFLTFRDFEKKRAALFQGECVNCSENRPALHTALRAQTTTPIFVQNENITPLVQYERDRFLQMADRIRSPSFTGVTQKKIKQVVHLGIGGSDLGPRMAAKALSHLKTADLTVHYVANSDLADLLMALENCTPEETLVIISSKSFSTQETLLNAAYAIEWLKKDLKEKAFLHVYAVTAQKEKALAYGILPEHIFLLWDWVGGRFSMWSAIGFPLAIQIGSDAFRQFLQGAYQADQHFLQQPLIANIPVLMATLDFWYSNFFNAKTKAILPYAEQLSWFPDYLQQLQMESNGKSVTQADNPLPFYSSMVLWGKAGSHGQHAFHQLFFQGTHFIPVDIILPVERNTKSVAHRTLTVANALSQARALMVGQQAEEAFKTVKGNSPSQFFLLRQLSAESLGMLCATYEHKVFVESVLLDINPFDQWGVELGKTLSLSLQAALRGEPSYQHDISSEKLLEIIKVWQSDHYKS